MQEIRIYHSIWRTLLLVLCGAAFTYASTIMLIDPRVNLMMKLVAVIGVVFFGLGSLFMLFMVVRERLAHQAFMTITDKGVVVRGTKRPYDSSVKYKSRKCSGTSGNHRNEHEDRGNVQHPERAAETSLRDED